MSAKKLNILLLFDWFYPDYAAGGPVRSCVNLIESTKGEINWYVECSNQNYATKQINPALPINQWDRLPFGGKVKYITLSTTRYQLTQIFKEKKWAAVYVNSMYSSLFGFQAISIAKKLHIKTIVCPRGMLAKGSVKQKWWLKLPFLKISNMLGWYNHVVWQATNEQEALDIKKWYKPTNQIHVLPNVAGELKRGKHQRVKQKNELKILCVSRISPEKNIDYLIGVLGQLTLPNLTLSIAGGVHNATYFESIKAKANQYKVRVDWLGYLSPDKINEQLHNHDLFALPTLGENYGHAIVESLRVGLPVLISDKTPWQGLTDLQAGWAIPLADKALFANKITAMHQLDNSEWEAWHTGAKNYFSKRIVQPGLAKQYIQLFTN